MKVIAVRVWSFGELPEDRHERPTACAVQGEHDLALGMFRRDHPKLIATAHAVVEWDVNARTILAHLEFELSLRHQLTRRGLVEHLIKILAPMCIHGDSC